MASVAKQGSKWTIRYRNRGDENPRRFTCPEGTTKREAQTLAKEIDLAVKKRGAWHQASAAPKDLRMLLEAYLEARQEDDLEWRAATPKTIANYRGILTSLVDHLGTAPQPHTLRKASVRKWLKARKADGVMPSTLSMYRAVVSTWWRWCHEKDPEHVPAPSLPTVSVPPRPKVRVPTFAEMDALLAQLNPNRCAGLIRAILICRYQGLRIGQARGLTWADWTTDYEKRGPALHIGGELAKTEEEAALDRWVPVHPALHRLLLSWRLVDGRPDPSEPIVGGKIGRPGGESHTLAPAWRRAEVPEEKWKGHSSHVFRKRFISALVENQVAGEVISYLVGHVPKQADIQETHYVDPDARFPLAKIALKRIPEVGAEVPGLAATASR